MTNKLHAAHANAAMLGLHRFRAEEATRAIQRAIVALTRPEQGWTLNALLRAVEEANAALLPHQSIDTPKGTP